MTNQRAYMFHDGLQCLQKQEQYLRLPAGCQLISQTANNSLCREEFDGLLG